MTPEAVTWDVEMMVAMGGALCNGVTAAQRRRKGVAGAGGPVAGWGRRDEVHFFISLGAW